MLKTLFLLLLCINGCAIDYNSPATIRTLAQSVVHIYKQYDTEDRITLAPVQRGYVATGFSFWRKGETTFILTNKHVCNMGSQAEYSLKTYEGNKELAYFVATDEATDLCVLKTNADIPNVELGEADAAYGDRLVVIGAPKDKLGIVVDGIASYYEYIEMEHKPWEDGEFKINFRAQVISAPVYLGNSGSPVFDIHKKVRGIVFAIRTDADHIGYMVPVSEIRRFLSTIGYRD